MGGAAPDLEPLRAPRPGECCELRAHAWKLTDSRDSPVGGRRPPGGVARGALEQRGELVDGAHAEADVEHGADERAVHVAQERVGGDLEHEDR